MGKQVRPAGYLMKILVLVRLPEDEDMVISAIRKNLDKRFTITLCNVVDPEEYGLSLENMKSYSMLKTIEEDSRVELNKMMKKLRKKGYRTKSKVLVGHMDQALNEEAESEENDMIVLIKRRTGRAGLEKHMTEAYSIASRYSGKVMIIRRE
jgi:nucleotide-binding universal stress UspA family protein